MFHMEPAAAIDSKNIILTTSPFTAAGENTLRRTLMTQTAPYGVCVCECVCVAIVCTCLFVFMQISRRC